MCILLAEDDSVLADGLTRSLRQSGYATDCVKSGVEADSALSTQDFDLLILGLGLSKMAGLKVMRRWAVRSITNGSALRRFQLECSVFQPASSPSSLPAC